MNRKLFAFFEPLFYKIRVYYHFGDL